MLKEPLISIIVPVYKVEKYLRQCIDSIIDQTYKNLEIILVDDGSPDNCPRICDEYSNSDKRIKVIHKENGGLSSARNAGLDICMGDYLSFIDSDDIISVKYIETLYNLCRSNNAEISECYYDTFADDESLQNINTETLKYDETPKVFSGHDMEIKLYGDDLAQHVIVCNKLYMVSLFNNIRFPVGKIHEDEFVTYRIYDRSKKVCVTKNCLYHYRENNDSITRKQFSIKRFDALDAFKERKQFYKSKNDDILISKTAECYQYILKKYFFLTKEYIEDNKMYTKEIVKQMKLNLSDINVKEIGFLNFIKYAFLAYFSKLYYWLSRVKAFITKK